MSTSCRFSTCEWSGSVDEIFTHCETYHALSIREHKNRNFYDFTFEDLTREAFLLNGKNGLYWFCLDHKNEATAGVDVLKRGVFHIGESEPIVYTLKLGSLNEEHTEYLGEFRSRSEHRKKENEVYDLEFAYSFLEFINEKITSRKMRLFVGEFDISADKYVSDSEEINWSASEEAVNKLCLERFSCSICMEYIRRDARFCERQHFVCLNCFDAMLKRSQLKCPICRADYPYDCCDPQIERLLRMVKFPNTKQEEAGDFTEQGSSTKRLKRQ